MHLSYIKEFRMLGIKLNFGLAAEALHITQPALSNHIKAIEDELGIKLVARGKGKNTYLTKAGILFFNRTEELIRLIDDIKDECSALPPEPESMLTVRMPILLDGNTKHLVAAAKKFGEEHPEIKVSLLSPHEASNPLEDLIDCNIDCCLCSIPDNLLPEGFATDRYAFSALPNGREEIEVCMDKDCKLNQKEAISHEDLANYSIAIENRSIAELVEHWLDGIFEESARRPEYKFHYTESFDTFMLDEFGENDIQVLPSRYRNHPVMITCENRIMRGFTPPIYSSLAVVFRNNDENGASRAFRDYLDRIYFPAQ